MKIPTFILVFYIHSFVNGRATKSIKKDDPIEGLYYLRNRKFYDAYLNHKIGNERITTTRSPQSMEENAIVWHIKKARDYMQGTYTITNVEHGCDLQSQRTSDKHGSKDTCDGGFVGKREKFFRFKRQATNKDNGNYYYVIENISSGRVLAKWTNGGDEDTGAWNFQEGNPDQHWELKRLFDVHYGVKTICSVTNSNDYPLPAKCASTKGFKSSIKQVENYKLAMNASFHMDGQASVRKGLAKLAAQWGFQFNANFEYELETTLEASQWSEETVEVNHEIPPHTRFYFYQFQTHFDSEIETLSYTSDYFSGSRPIDRDAIEQLQMSIRPEQGNLDFSKKCYEHPKHLRKDCGWPGISENTCVARGCCYREDHGSPWCYFTAEDKCAYPQDGKKTECGYPGITEYECEKKGCCFLPYSGRPNNPWCFKTPGKPPCRKTEKWSSLSRMCVDARLNANLEWERSKEGHYVYVGKHKLTHSEADKFCHGLGAGVKLVTPNNWDENQFFAKVAAKTHGSLRVWLGITQDETTDKWVRSDGSEVSYKPWCKGQPDKNGNTNERCVAVTDKNNPCWHDYQCHFQKHPICVLHKDKNTPTIKKIWCGGHHAYENTCKTCPPRYRWGKWQEKYWCNGQCFWDKSYKACVNKRTITRSEVPAALALPLCSVGFSRFCKVNNKNKK